MITKHLHHKRSTIGKRPGVRELHWRELGIEFFFATTSGYKGIAGNRTQYEVGRRQMTTTRRLAVLTLVVIIHGATGSWLGRFAWATVHLILVEDGIHHLNHLLVFNMLHCLSFPVCWFGS